MSWIIQAWRGSEKPSKIFAYIYVPMVLALSVVLSLTDSDAFIHRPYLTNWLLTSHTISSFSIALFILVCTIIAIWTLRSLWACAFNNTFYAFGLVIRFIVVSSAYGFLTTMVLLWMSTQCLILEQKCMVAEALRTGSVIMEFIKLHSDTAFSVCIKNTGHVHF